MRRVKLTESEKQWLIDNYSTTKLCDLSKRLMISDNTIRKYAAELGLTKDRKPVVEVNKPDEIPSIMDAGKGYCLDCAFYVVGGWCGKKARPTGALHRKECFKVNDR